MNTPNGIEKLRDLFIGISWTKRMMVIPKFTSTKITWDQCKDMKNPVTLSHTMIQPYEILEHHTIWQTRNQRDNSHFLGRVPGVSHISSLQYMLWANKNYYKFKWLFSNKLLRLAVYLESPIISPSTEH